MDLVAIVDSEHNVIALVDKAPEFNGKNSGKRKDLDRAWYEDNFGQALIKDEQGALLAYNSGREIKLLRYCLTDNLFEMKRSYLGSISHPATYGQGKKKDIPSRLRQILEDRKVKIY